ncbi:hypothetical protein WR25_26647 [Diploscapter pachys]|uniref:Uncharacterized protein n=1 Tax=Diploscapter pachys TaxID=2018661 RepID=A0A2A2KHR3_9BILA|nr:hypothetical protein WR25_26647 [Diploscapter pachys]
MSDLVENIENMDVNAIRDKEDKDMLENVEKLISDLDLDCKQEELQNKNRNKNKTKTKGSEEEAGAVEVQKDEEKLAANDVDEEKTESEEETQDNSSGDSSTTSDSCSAEGEERGCSVEEEKSKEESKIEAEKNEQKKTDGHGLDAGILTDRLNKSAAVQVKLTGNETDLANYSQDKTVNAPPSTPVVMTADELKPLVDGSTTAADEKQKMEHLRGGGDKDEDSSMHTAASPDPLLKQSNEEGSNAESGEEKNDNMQNPADNLDEKKKSVCSIC